MVSDYFGVTFIETQHKIAADAGGAAALALAAGVDVELPAGAVLGTPLLDAVLPATSPESTWTSR